MKKRHAIVSSAIILTVLLSIPAYCENSTIKEDQISSLSLHDQAPALRTNLIKARLGLREALDMLTTYKAVSREQYFLFAHQPGVNGELTLINGEKYSWEIEPGYAAIVRREKGNTVYLLNPTMLEDKVQKKDRTGAQ